MTKPRHTILSKITESRVYSRSGVGYNDMIPCMECGAMFINDPDVRGWTLCNPCRDLRGIGYPLSRYNKLKSKDDKKIYYDLGQSTFEDELDDDEIYGEFCHRHEDWNCTCKCCQYCWQYKRSKKSYCKLCQCQKCGELKEYCKCTCKCGNSKMYCSCLFIEPTIP